MPLERKSKQSRESKSTSTIKTDILISIKTPHITNIATRTKNHEFRKYMIPSTVERMWFYVSAPDQTLRYIAAVSHGKAPGEIEVEDGIGNADFNNGLKKDDAKFAYEILHLYRVRTPPVISHLKEHYGISPPQRYSYVPEALYRDIVLEDQEMIF